MATFIQCKKCARQKTQQTQKLKIPPIEKYEDIYEIQDADLAKLYVDMNLEEIEIKQTTLELLKEFHKFILSQKNDLGEIDFLEFWGKELFAFSRCIGKLEFEIYLINSKLQKTNLF